MVDVLVNVGMKPGHNYEIVPSVAGGRYSILGLQIVVVDLEDDYVVLSVRKEGLGF